MANYATLKAAIQQYIKQNGNNEITGALLQQELLAMVNSLGAGYQFVGVADLTTSPGTPDQNVVYFASRAGTYSNFSGIEFHYNEIGFLVYNGTWSKLTTNGVSRKVINTICATIQDKNGNFIEPGQITYDNGVYFNQYAGRGYGAMYGITDVVDISGIDNIIIVSKINDVGVAPKCIFFDADGNIVSVVFAETSDIETTKIAVPATAKFVRAQTYCYQFDQFGIYAEFARVDIMRRVDEQNASNRQDESTLICSTIHDKDNVFVKPQNLTDARGVYITNSGSYGYNASYGITDKINLQNITEIKVRTRIEHPSFVPMCLFYSQTDVLISVLYADDTTEQTKTVSVPSGAEYCIAQAWNTTKDFRVYANFGYTDIERRLLDSFEPNQLVYPDKKERFISNSAIVKIKETGGFASIIHKWGFIGDSLSSGLFQWFDGGQEPQMTDYFYSWGQRLMALIGQSIGTNFSVGGLTAASWFNRYVTNETPGFNIDGVGTKFTEDLKQSYCIMLGTNDRNSSVPVGNFDTDVNLSDYTQNANTFIGNYAKIIQKIKELQPSAKVFVITIPSIYASNMESLGYNPAIRLMATKFTNVFVADVANYIPTLDASMIDNFISDGHGTSFCYQWYAYIVGTLIDDIIEQNLDKFKWVCRIGTQYDDGNL